MHFDLNNQRGKYFRMKDEPVWRFWSVPSLLCSSSSKKVSLTGAQWPWGSRDDGERWVEREQGLDRQQSKYQLLISSSMKQVSGFLFVEICGVRRESTCNAGDLGSIPWSGRSLWRREWQPTSIFLPGEFHGQRNLAGSSPWGRKALEPTE